MAPLPVSGSRQLCNLCHAVLCCLLGPLISSAALLLFVAFASSSYGLLSYRLSITAVRNPAAANSVQLAQLNLYTTLDAPQPPSEALSGAIANLHTDANHSDSASAETYAKAVETLLAVLANVLQHSEEAKYRTLKSSNARVQSMLCCGDCFEEILKAVGFQPGTASRQGKQPPEAAWVLHKAPTNQKDVQDALRLLQSPHAFPTKPQKQTSITQSSTEQTDKESGQQPAADIAGSTAGTTPHSASNPSSSVLDAATSDAAKQDLNSVQSRTEAMLLTDIAVPVPVAAQASANDSNTAGDKSSAAQQGSSQQPTAAEEGHRCFPLDAQQQSSQLPAAAEQGHPGAPSHAPQQSSQQPTASQGAPTGLSEQSPQAAASTRENQESSGHILESVQGNDATDSNAHAGNNDPGAASVTQMGVQSSPMSSSSKAPVTDSSVPHFGLTPALRQEQDSETPAAPQHAAKSRVDSEVPMSVYKPLAFTPAAEPDIRRPHPEESPSQGVKLNSPSELAQADVATLIRVKFAELMASKQHTPNEAAVLAVQHVSAAQRS